MKEKYAVFTMDVEEFADTECVANSGQAISQTMLDGLDEYIRLLEKYDIRATMFTLCNTAAAAKEQLLRHVDNGHCIALHGLEHVPPRSMSDERFLRETREAKRRLEALLQTPVTGYRAPCFSLDGRKLDILRRLGFQYDSSRMDFSPARHTGRMDMNGFQELRRGVFRRDGFFEFGLSCQRLAGKNYPISGGGYVRLAHWSFIMPLIHSYLRESDYYVFYLHPFELSRQKLPSIRHLKPYDRYYLSHGRNTYRMKIETIIRMLKACGYRFVTFDELTSLLTARKETENGLAV